MMTHTPVVHINTSGMNNVYTSKCIDAGTHVIGGKVAMLYLLPEISTTIGPIVLNVTAPVTSIMCRPLDHDLRLRKFILSGNNMFR